MVAPALDEDDDDYNDDVDGNDNSDGSNSDDDEEQEVAVVPLVPANRVAYARAGERTTTSTNTKCYPMAFFTSSGKVPDSYEALVQRWKYRENRPPDTSPLLMDVTPFDMDIMQEEMEAMRKSLLKFADEAYTTSAKDVATLCGLTYSSGQHKIVRDSDLKSALLQLERSKENEDLAYKIFHHRIRTDKQWHVSIVDEWAASIHIHLLPPVDSVVATAGARKRNVLFNRQGFGSICLEARKTVIQRYMRALMTKKGWMIATTNKSKQSKFARKYARKTVCIEKQQYVYYVVEPSKGVSLV